MSQTATTTTTATTSRKHSVKEKFSSLVRRGSSLRLLDGARRDKKAAPAKVQYFTPLNVDLEKLQPIRLGWEEPEPTEQNDAKQKEENKKKEEKNEVPLSSTPIADMFAARRSTLDLSTLSFMRRPAPARAEPETETKSSEATSTDRTAPTASERRPTESRARSDSTQVRRNVGAQSQSGVKRDLVISTHLANNNAPAITTRHAVKEVSLLKPVENRVAPSPASEPFDASKRHSMPATPTVAQIQSTLAAKSAANGEDRRRSWQPASPATSTFSQGPPRASSRLAANRLAWIKELEEGKHRNQGGDPMLRNLRAGGSVADKLASFEAKKIGTPMGGGRLTRTNSIISRVSIMDSSYAGGTTTARTSIDTSHRASSVMSYYDDSFREKMESIAGNFAPKDGDEASDNKPTAKVTTQFVPV